MATLPVTVTHDFRGDLLSNIDLIDFTTTDPSVTATFSFTQFGVQIDNDVTIDGDANQNNVEVIMSVPGTFSAAAWTITNWAGDTVLIQGSNGNDTITGPAASAGFVSIYGGKGADEFHGGNANNFYNYLAGDIKAGEKIFGGSGQDSIAPKMDGSTYDFRLVTIVSVNGLLTGGLPGTSSKIILSGTQIGAPGNINLVSDSTASTTNLVVQGQTVDLSSLTFISWTEGVDTLRILGTKGADSLTGSFSNDIFTGGKGKDAFTGHNGDDVFDFNGKSDSLKGLAHRDVITDFSLGDNVAGGLDDDLINLKTIDANSHKAGNQAFKFVAAFHHKAGELLVKQDVVNGLTLVQGDIDGNGKSDFQIELTGLHSLTAADFVL